MEQKSEENCASKSVDAEWDVEEWYLYSFYGGTVAFGQSTNMKRDKVCVKHVSDKTKDAAGGHMLVLIIDLKVKQGKNEFRFELNWDEIRRRLF